MMHADNYRVKLAKKNSKNIIQEHSQRKRDIASRRVNLNKLE